MQKRKQNKIYWLLGIAVLCCIGCVFAYWTQELLVHNEFKTARYETNIEEKFVSPTNWEPGQETNKDVWLTNTGTVPAFAKIKVHQDWIRTKNVTDSDGNIVRPAEGENFPLSFNTGSGKEYAAQITWGKNVVLLSSGRNSSIDLGLPTVNHIEDAKGKWLLVTDVPDSNGDYLLYYIGTLEAGKKSPLLVDSVTMNSAIQPAVIRKDTYYDEKTSQWVTKTQKNSTHDYENAKYTMLITATTVQATADAVKDVFGTDDDNADIVKYLASLATDSSKW
jgi:alternate signal-mediated exported protein